MYYYYLPRKLFSVTNHQMLSHGGCSQSLHRGTTGTDDCGAGSCTMLNLSHAMRHTVQFMYNTK